MAYLLVIDDEEAICWGFTRLGEEMGHEVTSASSAERGIELAERRSPDLLVLDIRLPGMSGLEAMESLQAATDGAPIIVITAHGDLETAVEAIRQGAFDYIAKPFELATARRAIQRGLESASSPGAAPKRLESDGKNAIIGASPPMQQVFKDIALASVSDACVHIYGESGTGKELVARAIHGNSPRSAGPFVPIHVAAISPALAESELFGHVRGAFTGADIARTGLLEMAHGGTVFLDEIADIPLTLQVKLLRALEQGEFFPVGASEPVRSDFRLISAANQPLRRCIADGKFRHDLFYRLTAFTIELPPLHARTEDIPLLVRHFLQEVARRQDRSLLSVSDETMQTLQSRPWPGNVRELRNAIEHAGVLARTGMIMPEHLPTPEHGVGIAGAETDVLTESVREWIARQLDSGESIGTLYDAFLQLVEPPLLSAILRQADGNLTAAAELLGMHRSTLRKKCQEYGMR